LGGSGASWLLGSRSSRLKTGGFSSAAAAGVITSGPAARPPHNTIDNRKASQARGRPSKLCFIGKQHKKLNLTILAGFCLYFSGFTLSLQRLILPHYSVSQARLLNKTLALFPGGFMSR
jgi:hypothetical protein